MGFYIADQDTAWYSSCSAGENCVSWTEPLKCTTDNLFSLRVLLLNQKVEYFFEVIRWQVNSFQMIAGSSLFF